MNIFKKAYCRTFQFVLTLGMKLIRIPLPNCREGEESRFKLIEDIKAEKCSHPLFLVEQILVDLGLVEDLEQALKKEGIEITYFHGIKPNPTAALSEEVKKLYLDNHCDCLIALGGGSTIDLAKAVGILIAYPKKKIGDFAGILKIHRQIPPLFALPTTAGTGSETTLAAVIVDEATKDKYQIDAPNLVPKYAYLDGFLLHRLPKSVIAMTGMDALTHAIEALIGRANTKFTRKCAEDAIVGVSKYLLRFYENAADEEARNGMLRASYDAGNAFTRAFVGYVHALAHSLGGYYNLPHGYCNAILLPYVLRSYGSKINKISKTILGYFGVEDNAVEPYEALAAYCDNLNHKMNIPTTFEGKYDEASIEELAIHAYKEGNPLYPVPVLKSKEELANILRRARV